MALTVFTSAAFAAKRYDGADRYDTAIKIVEAGWEKADTAVVTTGGNPADALSAAPLAKSYDAPLLLVEKGAADTKYNAPVIKKLKDLGVKKVIIVGGVNAVTKSVEDAVKAFAEVERVSGADRYETSVEVARALAKKTGKAPVEVAVANGSDTSYADALSISSIAAYKGMPILLTGKNALPKAVADYVKDLKLTKSYVIGGTAVVSDAAKNALKESTRLAGANRYATNVAVLGAFDDVKYDKVYVATGNNFADALAGSALAAKTNSPVVLVGKTVDPSTKKFVDAKVTGKTEVFVLGGEKAISESVIDDLFGGALRLTSAKATGAKKIEVEFNKPVDTSKATIEVKKGSVITNIEKTDWSDNKKAVALTTNAKLTKGEYTVNVTVGDDKFSGKFTAEDEKVVKIELTSDKLALVDETNMNTAKVGYAVYNQYKEDIAKTASVTWNASPGTIVDNPKGMLTVTAPESTKFMLDQKVVITGYTDKGVVMSATVSISRKPYINEIVIGELKSSDDKVKVLNTGNINKFYFPVSLKDQYGNAIKEASTAALEVLAIKANIGGDFAKDDDGNLIFRLDEAKDTSNNPIQYPGKAILELVSKGSGIRDKKEFDILPTAVVKNFSIEFPDTIAAGDSKVELKYTAVDQFGAEVKDKALLAPIEEKLNESVGAKGIEFKFENDVKTKTVKLFVTVPKTVKDEKIFLAFITPGNEVYSGSFNVAKAREYKVVYGIKDVPVNYVSGAKGKIEAKNIVLTDQYGETKTLDKIEGITVDLAATGNATLSPTTINKTGEVTVTVGDKGTATITAGFADKDGKFIDSSVKTFKINVVDEDAVKSYEVKDIAMLNGNTGEARDIVVVGKLENGAEVVLRDDIIKEAVSSSVAVTVAGDKVSAKVEGPDKKDTAVSIVIVLKADVAPITKTVKVSYQVAVPAKVEAKAADKVEYVAKGITNEKIKDLFKVTDQYGDEYPSAALNVIRQELSDGTGANITVTTTNGLYDTVKLMYN